MEEEEEEKVNRSGRVAAHRRPPLRPVVSIPSSPSWIDASRRIGGEPRPMCNLSKDIHGAGRWARVPITHNRRVTNVLLIASSRTETRRTGKNRESSSRERERGSEREAGRKRRRGRVEKRKGKIEREGGNTNNPSSLI